MSKEAPDTRIESLLRKQNELLEDVAEGIAQLVNNHLAHLAMFYPTKEQRGQYFWDCMWTRPSKRLEDMNKDTKEKW